MDCTNARLLLNFVRTGELTPDERELPELRVLRDDVLPELRLPRVDPPDDELRVLRDELPELRLLRDELLDPDDRVPLLERGAEIL